MLALAVYFAISPHLCGRKHCIFPSHVYLAGKHLEADGNNELRHAMAGRYHRKSTQIPIRGNSAHMALMSLENLKMQSLSYYPLSYPLHYCHDCHGFMMIILAIQDVIIPSLPVYYDHVIYYHPYLLESMMIMIMIVAGTGIRNHLQPQC